MRITSKLGWLLSVFTACCPALMHARGDEVRNAQVLGGPCTAPSAGAVFELRQRRLEVGAEGVSGRFVLESHYATDGAVFGRESRFPSSSTEGIAVHLSASCSELKRLGLLPGNRECQKAVYDKFGHWASEWTPPEGGAYGQSAIGDARPPLSEEMWQANMNFAKLPAVGTRVLVRNPSNGKAVVVSMGREIGPSDGRYLGGVVPEIHWYLESDEKTLLDLRPLRDQALPFGPLVCSGA